MVTCTLERLPRDVNQLVGYSYLMRVRDAEATRRRLLAAATAEFATHGIAGARVDRIAAEAQVNKAQLYAYFGDKNNLFDIVFRAHAESITNTVRLDGRDLPGYAVSLYDAALERPELVRLAVWARLERVPTGELIPEATATAAKLRAIADAQRGGHIDASPEPRDILSLVLGMALTWSAASFFHTATAEEPASNHERRRKLLTVTVQRAFAVTPMP